MHGERVSCMTVSLQRPRLPCIGQTVELVSKLSLQQLADLHKCSARRWGPQRARFWRAGARVHIPRQGFKVQSRMKSAQKLSRAVNHLQFHPLDVDLHEVHTTQRPLARKVIERDHRNFVRSLL